ncbi:hypothetical protein [Glycomyces harbinensis]|uniref:Uncharacterized protein n=1 Tax=Glycomyces harbinensis TaxID=58114 RepID=A0A1G7DLF7_9ACTN|nr:hypothetical protein [Glycomyces harbinensis]SDE52361.1 hypothetical protein SAMN05216270_12627 [Glycomyces harbinensis]
MSSGYRLYTSASSLLELSSYFAEVLDLGRVEPRALSPIDSDRWWCAITAHGASDNAAVSGRLGVERYSTVAFLPRKSLSWESETKDLAKIVEAVARLLSEDRNASGFLEFYDEIIVLEKRKGGPITVDPRLLDPDDLDDQRAFAPLLGGYAVRSIEQL